MRLKRYLNAVFLIVSIVLLILAVMYLLRGAEDAVVDEAVYRPQVMTVAVGTGLEQEFGATGSILADQSASLTAELRSQVEDVVVQSGDWVEQGQLLVSLGAAGTEAAWETAAATFRNAQGSLDATDRLAQQSVAAARVALESSELNLENTLKQNAARRKQASEVQSASSLGQDLSVAVSQTTLDNAVSQTATTVRSALTPADRLLGVSAAYKNYNDDFESHLGALDTTTKSDAEDALREALNLLQTPVSDPEVALSLLSVVESSTRQTLIMLNNSVSSADFPTATLDGYVSTITGELATVRGQIATIHSAQSNLAAAVQAATGGSQVVLNAQVIYDSTITGLDTADASARRAVESARVALESATAAAKLSRTSAKGVFDSAQGSYDQATIQRDKLTLRAPFAGRVVSVPVRRGEEVLPNTLLVVLENPAVLKIIAYLSPFEVQKVRVGDLVRFGQKSTAAISAIAPSADPVSRKYRVEIRHQNPYLHPGEFLPLVFSARNSSASPRLFIPLTAVQVVAGTVSVWVVVDGAVQKRVIELGVIEGDTVEVLTGLQQGDQLVISGGRIIENAGTEVEVLGVGQP